MTDGGGNTDLQSSPSPNQGGVNINGQLRKAGVFTGPGYHKLKELCTSTPVVAYAYFKKPFRLHTDASILSLRAVFYQEQDGVESVISYAN